MEHASLLVTLVLALGVAVVGAAVAARLGQSVILGYILAGIVISPYTSGVLGRRTTVAEMADIGIILLLFALGVRLSFRDLLRVGPVALLGGTVQVLALLGLGAVAGIALGWPPTEALFFGAVIAISSSAALGTLLQERGEEGTEHGRIALAWSAVQDLGTIVLVVVLSALAGHGTSPVMGVLGGAGKAVLFLTLVVPFGVWVLPWLFERVAALHNRELFVLLVASVALGMAYASSLFGLSLALGAFVAGIVVGESDLAHQILGAILPLRDIFAALFFVSVGMLVPPLFVLDHLALVFLTLALIMLAKGMLAALLTLLFRYAVRTALADGRVAGPGGGMLLCPGWCRTSSCSRWTGRPSPRGWRRTTSSTPSARPSPPRWRRRRSGATGGPGSSLLPPGAPRRR